MSTNFTKGFSEYMKEFRDPKRRQRNPDEEPFAGMGTPNLDMNTEPPIQRKKRFDGFPVSKTSMEPPFQRKKRSDSASPIRQVLEPELQRKKKPIPYKKTAPIATQLPSTGNQNDDYMLLGDQSKFNENVKYRIRSRSAHEKDASPPPREHRPQRPDRVVSHPNPSTGDLPKRARPHDRPPNPVPPQDTPHKERQSRSKERGPPPRVVVDTGKQGRVTGKGDGGGLRLDLAKERSPSRKVSGEQHDRPMTNHAQKGILRKSAATQSTPRITGEDGRNGLPSNAQNGVPLKTEKRYRDEERPMKKLEEKRSTDKEARAPANQQRATAANQDRAGAPANQQRAAVPPNYAVKYRLGIAPHRSNGPIRFSEYQREFQWRDPIKSSPLISAETVVYKSHPDLTLFRSSSMAEDSEYKAQFKAWTPHPQDEVHNRKNDPHPQNKHLTNQPKKTKIQRSKSLKEMPTQPKHSAVSTAATDLNVVAKHAESDDAVTTGGGGQPKKKYRSEYSRNYVAPSNYLYDEGAWKKVHAKEDTEPELPPPRPSTAPASASAWYAEVLELRRFADEYRKRAQGTHFSREHLAQLYAKNAELWDALSDGSVLSSRRPTADDQQKRLHPNSSSVVAKGSVEKVQKTFVTKGREQQQQLLASENETTSARSENNNATESSFSDLEKENAHPGEKTRPQPTQQQRKRPHLAQTTSHLAQREHHLAQRERHLAQTSSGTQGRVIPSRDFEANYSDNDGSCHGYNSDPYEGSSPGSESSGYGNELKVTKVKGRVNQTVSSKDKTMRNQLKTNQVKSSSSGVGRPLSQLTTTIQSHGLPTRDTHVLIDSNGQDHHHHHHHHQGRWKTGHKGPAAMEFEDKGIQIQEEDLMSVSSARSLASSCSLASEVLERARNRRDGFWN